MAADHTGDGGLAGGLDDILKNLLQGQSLIGIAGCAVVIVAHDDAGGILELTGITQVGQHTVYTVGRLAHFFNEQDLALGVDLIGSTQRCGDQGQVTAHQFTLGGTAYQGLHSRCIGRILVSDLLAEQHSLHKGLAVLIQTGVPCTNHGHMVSNQVALLIQSNVQSSDVAVATEELGVLADHLEVQHRQDTRCAVAAADGHNTIDGGIGKSSIQVSGTLRVRTSQIAVDCGGRGIQHRLEAHCTDGSSLFLAGNVTGGAGSAQNCHAGTGEQRLGSIHICNTSHSIKKEGLCRPSFAKPQAVTYLASIAALKASIIMGTTLNRSPQMP